MICGFNFWNQNYYWFFLLFLNFKSKKLWLLYMPNLNFFFFFFYRWVKLRHLTYTYVYTKFSFLQSMKQMRSEWWCNCHRPRKQSRWTALSFLCLLHGNSFGKGMNPLPPSYEYILTRLKLKTKKKIGFGWSITGSLTSRINEKGDWHLSLTTPTPQKTIKKTH